MRIVRDAFVWFEPQVRQFMSSWRFWIGVAYFGLVMTFVLTIASFHKIGQAEAALIAADNATKAARVSSCYRERAEAPAVRRFLLAEIVIAESHRDLLESNIQQFPNDPRKNGPRGWFVSLLKIEATIGDLEAFLRQSRTTTPTRAKCDQMADTLGIPRQNVR